MKKERKHAVDQEKSKIEEKKERNYAKKRPRNYQETTKKRPRNYQETTKKLVRKQDLDHAIDQEKKF